MEKPSLLERPKSINYLNKVNIGRNTFSTERTVINLSLETILSEGGEDFFQYMQWIGMSSTSDLMVLSSMHHYYYDHEDLRRIKALVNIKRLNQIKHLETFMHTLYRILPSKAYFIGCFRSCEPDGLNTPFYHSSKILKGLINTIEYRVDRCLTKRSVTKILEDHGFKTLDITEINGTTYFLSQNIRIPGEI